MNVLLKIKITIKKSKSISKDVFLEKGIYIKNILASASTDVYSYFLLQTPTLQPNTRAATTDAYQNGLDLPRSTRTHRDIQLSPQ
jgi:hypothetical protein